MINTNGYALLCLLSIKPMSGYIMKCWVDKVLVHFWKTSYGQIYPTMKKFVEAELVTEELKYNENGVQSKYYTITEKGLEELRKWLMEETKDFNHRDESLLKYKFSYLLPIEDVIKKAEDSLTNQKEVLECYNNNITEMKKVTKLTREQLMTYLSTKKGIYLNEARTKWTEEVIRVLKQFDSDEL